MKKLIFLMLFLMSISLKGQNFLNATFVYNNVSYDVLHESGQILMLIHNSNNPQNMMSELILAQRKMNRQKLTNDVVSLIKSIVTPNQLILLQTERVMSMNLLCDATGKINIVEHFNLSYNTCLQPADIHNIEVGLKNLVMQFTDGLSPEAGRLGSIAIPKSMWR